MCLLIRLLRSWYYFSKILVQNFNIKIFFINIKKLPSFDELSEGCKAIITEFALNGCKIGWWKFLDDWIYPEIEPVILLDGMSCIYKWNVCKNIPAFRHISYHDREWMEWSSTLARSKSNRRRHPIQMTLSRALPTWRHNRTWRLIGSKNKPIKTSILSSFN